MPRISTAFAIVLCAAFATPSAKILSTASPCYTAYSAYINSDSASLRVRRIVTTGVRRFADSQTLASPACAAAPSSRAAELQGAVTAQLGTDARLARWVRAESTDSTIAVDHLVRLSRLAIADSAVVIVHVGSDSDLVALPLRR